MPRHLNESTLDSYLARTLDPSELRAYDAHLASCLSCALTVEREGLASERWERRGILGRLVSVVPAERLAA
jgi:anti-sigma factor RsiW